MNIKKVLDICSMNIEDFKKLNKKERYLLSIILDIQEELQNKDSPLVNELIKERLLIGYYNIDKLPIVTTNIDKLLNKFIKNSSDILEKVKEDSNKIKEEIVKPYVIDVNNATFFIMQNYPKFSCDNTVLCNDARSIITRLVEWLKLYPQYMTTTYEELVTAVRTYVATKENVGHKYLMTSCNFIYNKATKVSTLASYLDMIRNKTIQTQAAIEQNTGYAGGQFVEVGEDE